MKTLIVITGPTGVGKTDAAIEVARSLGTEIISADSRQVYRDIPITTAAPSSRQLAQVRHHFIGTLPLDAYFSAALFEQEALEILRQLFLSRDYAVVCGGSMLYVDALCHGIDPIPTISPATRLEVLSRAEGLATESLLNWLGSLDPEYRGQVDPSNRKRIIHAIEICLQSGLTYSSLRSGKKQSRPFRVVKIGLTAPRDILFARINSRAEAMIRAGMEKEARALSHLRHLNSLNTVGFKEMFRYIDGEWDLPTALARLQKNTRVFAKKQLTWLARPGNETIMLDTSGFDDTKALAAEIIGIATREC